MSALYWPPATCDVIYSPAHSVWRWAPAVPSSGVWRCPLHVLARSCIHCFRCDMTSLCPEDWQEQAVHGDGREGGRAPGVGSGRCLRPGSAQHLGDGGDFLTSHEPQARCLRMQQVTGGSPGTGQHEMGIRVQWPWSLATVRRSDLGDWPTLSCLGWGDCLGHLLKGSTTS